MWPLLRPASHPARPFQRAHPVASATPARGGPLGRNLRSPGGGIGRGRRRAAHIGPSRLRPPFFSLNRAVAADAVGQRKQFSTAASNRDRRQARPPSAVATSFLIIPPPPPPKSNRARAGGRCYAEKSPHACRGRTAVLASVREDPAASMRRHALSGRPAHRRCANKQRPARKVELILKSPSN